MPDQGAADGGTGYDHVGVVRCGRSRREEHHLPHRWVFQAEDDSPRCVEADCPGWAVDRG